MKKTNILKNTISFMLCAVLIVAGMWMTTEQSSAISKTGSGNISWYSNVPDYTHGFNVIGEAYVVGSDNKVQTNSFGRGTHVDAYSAYGSKYASTVKGNIQNLYNLYYSSNAYGGAGISWPSNVEYYLCEGEKVAVIGYDDTYAYYYSPGFKSFGNSLYNCDTSTLLESHPAGVYKVKMTDVWLDLSSKREVATSTNYVGTAQITRASAGVFQSLDMIGTARCYGYPVNTEIKIVDATPVTVGDYDYYKAVIKGDNAVDYLECNNFYVYVNTESISYRGKDVAIPAESSVAKVTGVGQGKVLKVYGSKESTTALRGLFADDAKLKTYPKMSDDKRTCIWHNDGYAYISTKYVKYYVDQLNIKNIVNDKYVLSWDPVPVEVTLTAKENWGGKQVKIDGKSSITLPAYTSTYTVKNSLLYGYEGSLSRQGVEITVHVKGDDSEKGSHKLYVPQSVSTLNCRKPHNNQLTINASWMGKDYGTVLEYSTNKNFKNAKKVYPKKNNHDVKKLKKNTKYYFRAYNTFMVDTENGKKLKKGKTTKVYSVKTANITLKKPTITRVSCGRKSITIKYKKNTGTGNKYEIWISTDKKFKKNVKKGTPTRSITEIRFSGLKANKKYYVKMRVIYDTYTPAVTSAWTKVKTVKTR